MQNNNLQPLKGFRDFLPTEKRRRDFVANAIKLAFERFGFEPLETPTLEYASLLLGKYGDEADKLVYSFTDRGDRQVALRYDQTVPTARVLAQYRSELPKYFRRYQIQNVFRADKPQQRRYREFTQCDCDIFDSTSPLADAEILAVFASVYQELGFGEFVIEVNDRASLIAAIEPFATETVSTMSIIQTIDKLDKQTEQEVITELVTKGLTQDAAADVLSSIAKQQPSTALQTIIDDAIALGVPKDLIKFNPALARGLDYYTGLIFEGKVNGFSGSVGAGGRYDKLIEQLSGVSIPAVGFGIGFDRTVEVANELNLLPENLNTTKVLVTLFDETTQAESLKIATALRNNNVPTEVYPTLEKLGKQFKYADQKGIPYVIIIGSDERSLGKVTLKNMATGEQQLLDPLEVSQKI